MVVLCYILLSVVFAMATYIFMFKKFGENELLVNKFDKQYPVLYDAVESMVHNNIFIYFNNVASPEMAECFLKKFSEAWTEVSAMPEFEKIKLSVGYSFNNTKISKELHDEMERAKNR